MQCMHRTPLESGEKISKTDVSQLWRRFSEMANKRCELSSIAALYHVKEVIPKYPLLQVCKKLQGILYKKSLKVISVFKIVLYL